MMHSPEIEDVYPLVPMQKSLLSETLQAPETGMYVEQTQLTLRGQLNVDAFEEAWRDTIAGHAVLRTGFVWQRQNAPLQVVRPNVPLPLTRLDWRGLTAAQVRERESTLVAEDRRRGFDLHLAPLMRLGLIQLDDEVHRLLWSHHHIILDGWSVGLVLDEVERRYRAGCEGTGVPRGRARPYRDYVAWVQQRDTSADEPFWRTTLAGYEPVHLPVLDDAAPSHEMANPGNDSVKPGGEAAANGFVETALSPHESERVRLALAGQRLTLSTAVNAAWALVLARYSGSQDVALGMTTAARPEALSGAGQMVGLFVNTIPLRLTVDPGRPVEGFLADVQAAVAAALQHEQVSLRDVQGWSGHAAGPSLFETVVVVQNATRDQSLWTQFGALKVSDVDFFVRTGFPVLVMVLPAETLRLRLIHDPSRLTEPMAARLLGHLRTALVGLCDTPGRALSTVPMLTGTELELIERWNDTTHDMPDQRPVHRVIAEVARRQPDAPALAYGDHQTTYAELDGSANRLAHVLMREGAGPGAVVALMLSRSAELIVAILAAHRAGAAFCVLNPADPPARLISLMTELSPRLVVTRSDHRGPLAHLDVPLLLLDECRTDAELPIPPAVPDDARSMAYAVFTSGSTGTPKIVQVEHLGLRNVTDHHCRLWELSPADIVLQFCAITFDVFILEVFATLASGACLLIADQETVTPGPGLVDLIDSCGVTVVAMTPSALDALPAEATLPGVHTISVLGERCPGDLVRRFAPGRRFFNLYGPAEASIIATAHLCDASVQGDPPIGAPIVNTTCRVLAGDGTPLPVGVPGELHLGGAGLARGYAGRPEQTAQAFCDTPHGRLYRTGDVARRRQDGGLDFLGRVDHQVKVRGFRVEPAEVEAVLRRHPAVDQAVVVGHGEGSRRGLAGYVVMGKGGRELDGADSAEQVRAWRDVYDQTYAPGTDQAAQDDETVGWRSSYTGEPLSGHEMQEWAEDTLSQILALDPARVLDIGCGTGMILLPAARAGIAMTGTDSSPQALTAVSQQLDDPTFKDASVRLVESFADDFSAFAGEQFDVVVINSVIQYFPDGEYLRRVLDGAFGCLAPGGHVLVGDVRSLPLLEAFQLSLLLEGPPSGLSVEEARVRARAQAEAEEELVVHPDFFRRYAAACQWPVSLRVLAKSGSVDNEMNRFRYDVVLTSAGPGDPALPARHHVWAEDLRSLADLAESLAGADQVVRLSGIPDSRNAPVLSLVAPGADSRPDAGVPHPHELASLVAEMGYSVDFLTGPDAGSLTALIVASDRPDRVQLLIDHGSVWQQSLPEPLPWEECSTDPLRRRREQRLIAELHSDLTASLPTYLRPNVLLALPELPFGPNGKVDRMALPSPTGRSSRSFDQRLSPRDSAELVIERIWAKALGVEHVGVTEDFFQVGGNSLLAMLVTSQLSRAFDQDIDLRTIFARPTIQEIALVLREKGGSSRDPAVPLQSGGDEPPLFAWHPAAGNVLAYQPLSRALGNAVPFWGLEELPGTGGTDTIEAMVSEYLAILRRIQPHGPYRLGGWSFGGLVAYEAARQLTEIGEEVALVVLFDSALPVPMSPVTPQGQQRARRFLRFASYLSSTFGRSIPLALDSIRDLDEAGQLAALIAAVAEAGILTSQMDESLLHGLYAAYQRSIGAASRYVPGPYEGKVVLYRASDPLPEEARDEGYDTDERSMGWSDLCPALEIVDVSGNHLTLLGTPHVSQVAADLGPRLSGGWGPC